MSKKKNNDEELDFFDEKELKSNREAIDMDMSFIEPKKNHFFGKFILFLLIITMGIGVYYFLVLNAPKKLFTIVFDTLTKENNEIETSSVEELSTNYKLGFNINSTNNDYQELSEIINKITISGTLDITDDYFQNSSIINYDNEEIINALLLLNTSNSNAYLKLNNLYDKVIKFDASEEVSDTSTDSSDENYLDITTYIIRDFKSVLDGAEYKRELVKLGNTFVKKDTLVIDNKLIVAFYTKLLQDTEFLYDLSDMTGLKVEEVSDYLNKQISELNVETKTLSIYTSIIKNDFVKLEYLDNGDNLTITGENNKITFEIMKSYTVKYQGFINLNEDGTSNILTLNISIIDEKTTIELTLEYSNNKNISKLLDINSAIDYSKMTEEDQNQIIENIKKNKALMSLLEKLGLNYYVEDQTISS